MHAISSYRGKLTDSQTHTPIHPQTGQITIHCTAASAQCNKIKKENDKLESQLQHNNRKLPIGQNTENIQSAMCTVITLNVHKQIAV